MLKSKNIFNKVEAIVLKLIILGLLITIFYQFIHNNNISSAFSQNLAHYNDYTIDKGKVILKLENSDKYKNVKVLVNGEELSDFKKSNEVKITVNNNDIIEINSGMYNENIKVTVVGLTKNIQSPKLDTYVITNSNIEILGKVILN